MLISVDIYFLTYSIPVRINQISLKWSVVNLLTINSRPLKTKAMAKTKIGHQSSSVVSWTKLNWYSMLPGSRLGYSVTFWVIAMQKWKFGLARSILGGDIARCWFRSACETRAAGHAISQQTAKLGTRSVSEGKVREKCTQGKRRTREENWVLVKVKLRAASCGCKDRRRSQNWQRETERERGKPKSVWDRTRSLSPSNLLPLLSI